MTSNVVVLPIRRNADGYRRLMDDVYAAGPLILPVEDVSARVLSTVLASFGLLVVEALGPDGQVCEATGAGMRARPWRVSRPPFEGPPGVPEACAGAVLLQPGPGTPDQGRRPRPPAGSVVGSLQD